MHFLQNYSRRIRQAAMELNLQGRCSHCGEKYIAAGPRQHNRYWFWLSLRPMNNFLFVPRPFMYLEMGPQLRREEGRLLPLCGRQVCCTVTVHAIQDVPGRHVNIL
jgi:hypothetical protein